MSTRRALTVIVESRPTPAARRVASARASQSSLAPDRAPGRAASRPKSRSSSRTSARAALEPERSAATGSARACEVAATVVAPNLLPLGSVVPLHVCADGAEVTRRAKIDSIDRLWRTFARRPRSDVRNLLVERYQTFVADIVRRFAVRLPPFVDDGDLITAANFGLIAAIESFDPRRGVPFESYCELRVRGALLDELRSQDWLPRPWRARIERHKRVVESLRAQLSREPDDTEIATALEMTFDEYTTTFSTGSFTAPSSTSAHAGDADGGVAVLDIVADNAADLPIERLTREEMLGLVTDSLTPQECRIVYLKYWEDLPLREIGELEGLSESRVCKIHLNLLERLQARFLASDRA